MPDPNQDDGVWGRPQGRFAPQGGGLRPSLTPTPHAVPGTYGRDEETASQPNQETDLAGGKRHTSRPPGEAEHYRKLVTHVPGLKCYPCGRLKTPDPIKGIAFEIRLLKFFGVKEAHIAIATAVLAPFTPQRILIVWFQALA
jgi:hypothetical protein